MASPPEEHRNREDSPTMTKEMLYKTKLIQFLGRNTPIVLQNDNGPCPLLAICNVLLLRNNLNLSSDVAEVSQEKLLSLVAERLIDSNSNVNNKDAGYVENQQQNIADAIDLLPRLTTGIDVNIKFTRIDDFEFTRECAIFDLLDIPLYHGWIVDPQDSDTSSAIGLKSYNTLMGELVALETQNPASESKNSEEDSVDFVAATTASLGVPSPSLSRAKSFDDSPCSDSKEQKERKGDLQEEEELLRALKLSETGSSPTAENNPSEDSNGSSLKKQEEQEPKHNDDLISFETVPGQDVCSSLVDDKHNGEMETPSEKHDGKDEIKKTSDDILIKSEKAAHVLDESDPSEKHVSKDEIKKTSNDVSVKYVKDDQSLDESYPSEKHDSKDEIKKTSDDVLVESEKDDQVLDESDPSEKHDTKDEIKKTSDDVLVKSERAKPVLDESDPFEKHDGKDEKIQDQSVRSDDVNKVENIESIEGLELSIDESKSLTSNGDGSEPIYEGEECIQETSTTNCENGEPMYEGEVVLAEQVDKAGSSADETTPKGGITPRQGELIRNFLKNSANQLTIYGLFSLQEGLKERELCVFFRNNHFNTMFKFEGELYLLATDQGYINQPDLVWEKLNEVNGDTVFMTSNFKEFNAENPDTCSWDEQNALANTAEYLASIDNTTQENTGFSSDLQLAIALQQQEFEQQQQPQAQRNLPQPNTGGESRLVTGPQHVQPSRPRSSSSSKQESKSSKEKCTVM